ncbi:hypothetical protein V502_06088 [Pseudogymnoascus sp. VKM F-4520 (FW-2644)]|nr:hypothetical protein V502_06088 [Pseudogymnoascus sp. VKM F-4520 (FW-2644)]
MGPDSNLKVSVIGLGVMGYALAQAFAKKDLKPTVWNRCAQKALGLEPLGAVVVPSASECIKASRLIVVCLVNEAAFHNILSGVEPAICKGRIIVNATTGAPSQIKKSAELAMKLGFSTYIHGAIMTFPAYIGYPESKLWFSGSRAAYEEIEPTLRVLGSPSLVGEEITTAGFQDIVCVNMLYGFAGGFLQSLALYKTKSGWKPGDTEIFARDVLLPMFMRDGSAFLDLARQVDAGDYVSKGNGAKLGQQLFALDNIIKTNTEHGIASDFILPMRKLLMERTEAGGVDEELSAIVEVLSDPAR